MGKLQLKQVGEFVLAKFTVISSTEEILELIESKLSNAIF